MHSGGEEEGCDRGIVIYVIDLSVSFSSVIMLLFPCQHNVHFYTGVSSCCSEFTNGGYDMYDETVLTDLVTKI